MSKVWLSIRFSSVGVLLTGVGSAITGCTAEDAIKALLIWLALALGGGAVEEATTGGAPMKIVLFSDGAHNGDFASVDTTLNDPRTGADQLCATSAAAKSILQDNVHAFLSIDGTDQLKDFPAQFSFSDALPIVGPMTTLVAIADDWADIFDFGVDGLLADFKSAGAAVGAGDGKLLWTGSTSAGTIESRTCIAWTTPGSLGRRRNRVKLLDRKDRDLQRNGDLSRGIRILMYGCGSLMSRERSRPPGRHCS